MLQFRTPLLLITLFLSLAAAQPTPLLPATPAVGQVTPFTALDRLAGGTVGITTETAPPLTGEVAVPWQVQGSGVVLDGAGHVLTSYRLVQGRDQVTVHLRGGRSALAQVTAVAPEQDLALLSVAQGRTALTRPVVLGDSDRVTAGSTLLALGLTPAGELTAQEVRVRATGQDGHTFLLDAPLPPETRGGPLLNAAGEVVALSTGRFSAWPGLLATLGTGSALPINEVKRALPALQAHTRAAPSVTLPPARLGIRFVDLRTLSGPTRRDLNLPEEGMLVQQVEPNSPAARAGLRGGTAPTRTTDQVLVGGDVIVAIDGTRLLDADQLLRVIHGHAPGTKVNLEILRAGQTRVVTVTLDSSRTL